MAILSGARFEYISCRGNHSVDFEISRPFQKCIIFQMENNCPNRIMKNVGAGYLFCSYDLLRLCDKKRIINFNYCSSVEVSEQELIEMGLNHLTLY